MTEQEKDNFLDLIYLNNLLVALGMRYRVAKIHVDEINNIDDFGDAVIKIFNKKNTDQHQVDSVE